MLTASVLLNLVLTLVLFRQSREPVEVVTVGTQNAQGRARLHRMVAQGWAIEHRGVNGVYTLARAR